jgi:hypothetical protein
MKARLVQADNSTTSAAKTRRYMLNMKNNEAQVVN